MKKRIFAGIMLVFMTIMSVVPVFAAPADEAKTEAQTEAKADNAEAKAAATEEGAEKAEPEPKAAAPAAAPEKFPELPASNAFAVKDVAYGANEQTLTFKIVNKTDADQVVLFILLEYDTSALTLTGDQQKIFPAEIAAPQIQVNMEKGIVIPVRGVIGAGEEVIVKLDALLAEGQKELPAVNLTLMTQDAVAELNLSSQEGTESVRYAQTFGNIFAINATGSFFADFGRFFVDNLALVIAFILLVILMVAFYFATINKAKKMIAAATAEECEEVGEEAETDEAECDEAESDETEEAEEAESEDEKEADEER